jgi:hypothetical protein
MCELQENAQWVMSWVMGLCSVWYAGLNTPSHTSWRAIWRKNSGLREICGAHGLVVGRRVMLGEVVTEVFTAGFPVDEEMVLTDAVADPIEVHIHGAGSALADGRIDYAIGSGIVGLDGRRWLGVAHLIESGTENFGCLAVDVECPNFGLSGQCHEIVQDAAFGMDAAIVGLLVLGSFGRIYGTGT